jgi:hypothetical protein
MSRYLHDLLIWIAIVLGAFCSVTTVLYSIWLVLLPKLKAKMYREAGRIHAIVWGVIILGAISFEGLNRAVFGVKSTFLWAYVLVPVLCGLPIIASYSGLWLARRKRKCTGVSAK